MADKYKLVVGDFYLFSSGSDDSFKINRTLAFERISDGSIERGVSFQANLESYYMSDPTPKRSDQVIDTQNIWKLIHRELLEKDFNIWLTYQKQKYCLQCCKEKQ